MHRYPVSGGRSDSYRIVGYADVLYGANIDALCQRYIDDAWFLTAT
jgi:hypothetical protein